MRDLLKYKIVHAIEGYNVVFLKAYVLNLNEVLFSSYLKDETKKVILDFTYAD
ncbi:hypothetical protein IRB23SM22_22480 [Alkalibacterium sp. s-m-22]